MRKKIAALTLLLSMTAALCVPSALAGGTSGEGGVSAGEADPAAGKAVTAAGPDEGPDLTLQPDAEGPVSFENLERAIRSGDLQLRALEENVQALESLDYEDMKEDLRKSLHQIASGQWMMSQYGQGDTLAHAQLDQTYDALREQFDAIRDGELQEDNDGLIRQLNEAEDQICLAGESLYIALQAMEIQEDGLERQLAALDRTVQEMELRYRMGQISALQLTETKAGRSSLASGLETLRMNIRTCKLQLETMTGAEMTGQIQLGALPSVTDAELESMDLEKDLSAAKEKSYTLYDAKQKLDDAKDDWIDSLSFGQNTYQYKAGQHNWQSAQYTYDNAVRSYELKFRTLYEQVGDYRQIWENAKVSLASQQAKYASQELRYHQGTISQNVLLSAEDDLHAAEEKVRSAAGDLFSTYNTYRWAVQRGILN